MTTDPQPRDEPSGDEGPVLGTCEWYGHGRWTDHRKNAWCTNWHPLAASLSPTEDEQ